MITVQIEMTEEFYAQLVKDGASQIAVETLLNSLSPTTKLFIAVSGCIEKKAVQQIIKDGKPFISCKFM